MPLLGVWKPPTPWMQTTPEAQFSWDKHCDPPAIDPKLYMEAIISDPKNQPAGAEETFHLLGRDECNEITSGLTPWRWQAL